MCEEFKKIKSTAISTASFWHKFACKVGGAFTSITKVHEAINLGDFESVQKLMKTGYYNVEETLLGRPPLVAAVYKGNKRIILFLVADCNANTNAPIYYPDTAETVMEELMKYEDASDIRLFIVHGGSPAAKPRAPEILTLIKDTLEIQQKIKANKQTLSDAKANPTQLYEAHTNLISLYKQLSAVEADPIYNAFYREQADFHLVEINKLENEFPQQASVEDSASETVPLLADTSIRKRRL